MRPTSKHSAEAEIAEVFGLITDRLNANEDLRLEEIKREFPQHADAIEPIFPTLKAMARLGTNDVSDSDQQVGKALGDYRLIRELGRGGMGIVYEAEQLSLRRRVAVKVLPFAALLNQRQLQRFKNEAMAAAILKHPNIVSVFAVGQDRGIHYYAMELVEGMTLADVIARQRGIDNTSQNEILNQENSQRHRPRRKHHSRETSRESDWRSAVEIAIQAADALHFAHQQGVIHRDVKPSNLLIDAEGQLFVTDFGLARVQSGENVTVTGEVVGTLSYMSPEQLEDGRVADQRSDIYSLGLTLFELLTLRPAFTGSSRQHLSRQISAGKTVSPRKTATVPRDVDRIVQKACSREPADRYSTASEFRDDLERVLRGQPVSARNIGPAGRFKRWASRNRLTSVLCMTILLLLLGVSIGSSMLARHALEDAKDKTKLLYARDIRLADSAIKGGDYEQALAILSEWSEPDFAAVRNFEWDYLWTRCHSVAPRNSIDVGMPATHMAYSNDGKRLAVSSYVGRKIRVFDTRTTTELPPREAPDAMIEWLCPVAEDEFVTAVGENKICFWDASDDEVLPTDTIELEHSRDWRIRSLACSADQRWIAVGVRQGDAREQAPAEVRLFDREKRTWQTVDRNHKGTIRLAFSNDEKQLIVASNHTDLRILSTETWNVRETLDKKFEEIEQLVASASQPLVACASATARGDHVKSHLAIWNIDTGQRIFSTFVTGDRYLRPSFSHDGRWLAVGTEGHALHLVDVASSEMHTVRAAHSSTVYAASFTPDGRFLATSGADRKVRVWRTKDLVIPQNNVTVFHEHESLANAIFIDAETVCSADQAGNLFRWNARTGRVRSQHKLSSDSLNYTTLTASPDGQWLAAKRAQYPAHETATLSLYRLPDLTRHKGPIELPGPAIPTPRDGVFTHSSQKLIVICGKKLVRIDVQSGTVEGESRPHEKWIKGVIATNDGSVVCVDDAGMTHFYDASTLNRVLEPHRSDSRFTHAIALSPNGQTYATGGSDGIVRIWDYGTRKCIKELPKANEWILRLAFSPDGNRIVSTNQLGLAKIFDPASGEHLLSLKCSNGWNPVCQFSPDGSILLSGYRELRCFLAAPRDSLQTLRIQTLSHLGCE